VFSLEQDKFITPENCSRVIFNDETKTIECHYPLEDNIFAIGPHYEATYDYDGNLINRIKIG
jgi:hypothetical protein